MTRLPNAPRNMEKAVSRDVMVLCARGNFQPFWKKSSQQKRRTRPRHDAEEGEKKN